MDSVKEDYFYLEDFDYYDKVYIGYDEIIEYLIDHEINPNYDIPDNNKLYEFADKYFYDLLNDGIIKRGVMCKREKKV